MQERCRVAGVAQDPTNGRYGGIVGTCTIVFRVGGPANGNAEVFVK